jgi:hypothetical protein
MVEKKSKFVIQSDNDMTLFYKKDRDKGEWVTEAKCSKFSKREDAKKHEEFLNTYFKIPCRIVKQN